MQRSETSETNHQQGFTLIELSIVLVIIGLIIGGVLVGQDLIKAAEVRATIGQIEKYNSAVNTFLGKYNGLPGDLTSDNAASFGFVTRNGATGRGDGNGLLQSTVVSEGGQLLGQEQSMFWNDLSTASLVDGNFTGADSAAPIAYATPDGKLPPAKIGRGNYVTVGSTGGINYYLVAGVASTASGVTGYSINGDLTPIEASNMDIKVDDGIPLTGVVQAHVTTSAAAAVVTATPFTDLPKWSSTATIGSCTMGGTAATDTTSTYNRSITVGGNSPACVLRFRFN